MDAVHGQLLPDAVVWLCRRHHTQVHAKHDSRFFKLEEAVKEFQRRLRKNDEPLTAENHKKLEGESR